MKHRYTNRLMPLLIHLAVAQANTQNTVDRQRVPTAAQVRDGCCVRLCGVMRWPAGLLVGDELLLMSCY